MSIGQRHWAIAEGYIPSDSPGPGRAFESHETACLLSAGDQGTHVTITLYFSAYHPLGPYRVTVPAARTLHLRFNDLNDSEPVPRDTNYACMIESNVPIIVRNTA